MNETKQLLIISSILGVCGLGIFLYKSDELENLDATEDEKKSDDEEVNSEYAKVKKQNKTRRVGRQLNGTRRKIL